MNLSAQNRGLLWLIVIAGAVAMVLDWSLRESTVDAPEPAIEKRSLPAVHRARADLPALFSSDDYPLAALQREEQGTVAFTLGINEQGRVERCYITQSSGSATLDHATCSILTKRARFTPARSADGRAVADIRNSRIRWLLPEE